MKLTLDWDTTNNTWKKKTATGSSKVEGTCACMSLHWVKKCLVLGRKLKDNTEMAANNAMSAAFVKHNKDQDTGGGEWLRRFFEGLGVDGTVKVDAMRTIAASDVPTSVGGYALSFFRDDGNGALVEGHTVAIYRTSSYNAFYDPNYGQYSAKNSMFSSFRNAVKNFISMHYSNFTGAVNVYKITLG
jgi:hypothetical protein